MQNLPPGLRRNSKPRLPLLGGHRDGLLLAGVTPVSPSIRGDHESHPWHPRLQLHCLIRLPLSARLLPTAQLLSGSVRLLPTKLIVVIRILYLFIRQNPRDNFYKSMMFGCTRSAYPSDWSAKASQAFETKPDPRKVVHRPL